MTTPTPSGRSTDQAVHLHHALDERARHDDTLLVARSTLFVAIMSAIIGAEILAAIYNPRITVLGHVIPLDLTFIPTAGAYFSLIWGFVTERTIAGQRIWREMVIEAEKRLAPFGDRASFTLERTSGISRKSIVVDLARPVGSHNDVFHGAELRWYLRMGPNDLSKSLPYVSAVTWAVIQVYGAFVLDNLTVLALVLPALFIVCLRVASLAGRTAPSKDEKKA